MWLIWLVVIVILTKLYSKLTTGKCYSGSVMTGKVVLVTGANSGIGYETALEIAKRGGKVILACRDDTKGRAAADSITKASKNKFVRYEQLDLSSFKSIREFVKRFVDTEAKLDVLINNATASGMGTEKTDDGVIRDMQVNHFGPFLLTVLLAPMLKKSEPSRVVNVSSYFHKFGTIEKINEEGRYGHVQVFCNSKLCNVLFSNELARRLEGSGVVVNCLHPGQLNNCFYKNSFLEKFRSYALYLFLRSPREGAQTAIYLAVSSECDQVTGKYFVDCERVDISSKARDTIDAEKLWAMSEDLVKLTPEEINELNLR